ncbi:MAG: 2,3-bisphosphoglycerate-independent phosphoglycerate mutase, partial [Pseudomonadota bacterium]
GRVVWMDLPKIDRSIDDGEFAGRPALKGFLEKLRETGGAAHLMGLMSPGGVHAHQRHIAAAAAACSDAGVPVRLHLFLDGRDTPPKSAADYLKQFETQIDGLEDLEIATVSGRFFAMDRDKRWERVSEAWTAIVEGARAESLPQADDAAAAIAAATERGETDEFVQPTVVGGYKGVSDGDGLFMLNFRADRAREILTALLDPDFTEFERTRVPYWGGALGMVEYSEALNALMPAMFPQKAIPDTLGAWTAAQGKTQFRLAETEKYPHVTFFLNGGVETPNAGEERRMPASPKVKTYDLAPEMAAADVTEALTNAIRSRAYDLIVCNYANPDMVGHTGDLKAAIRAVETVDQGLGAAVDALDAVGGAMLVTADHGNCEMMVDPATGGPHTAHTTNPVPIILVGGAGRGLRDGGRLADVAPSLLALMGLPQPAAMTGRSLLTDPEPA